MALLSYLPSTSEPQTVLHLSQSKTFKLAVFSDLHFGEDEHSFGPEQDRKSLALMRRVLPVEKPDLVVLNGDLITGENTFDFNSTDYVAELVEPLVEGGYKWASTYGNHDSKYDLSREGIYDAEKKFENSLTQHGDPATTDGITNYVLPIYLHPSHEMSLVARWTGLFFSHRRRRQPRPVALLWFLDSRGGASYQHLPANQDDIPNHVSARTAAWLQKKSAQLKRVYGVLPSLAFMHIPVRAFADLQDREKEPTVHGSRYPGMNDDKPLARQGYSESGNEGVPIMEALLGMEGLHSVYSGHDHGDSWCGRWSEDEGASRKHQKRPFLCFCKHSGWGGYGTWNRGVRQVRLAFDDRGDLRVETWVRMEGGWVVTAVTLNETYGADVYPVDDGGYHDHSYSTTSGMDRWRGRKMQRST